jgi:hypothetical protein
MLLAGAIPAQRPQGQAEAPTPQRSTAPAPEGFGQFPHRLETARRYPEFEDSARRSLQNSTDWHRLLEICALADTLMFDEDAESDVSGSSIRISPGECFSTWRKKGFWVCIPWLGHS